MLEDEQVVKKKNKKKVGWEVIYKQEEVDYLEEEKVED